MNDRELLDLAAKAAGYEFASAQPNPALVQRSSSGALERVMPWNPLTDDGDALRLAVKLRLVIQHAPKYVVVMDGDRNVAEHQDTREHDGDEFAATRRAIVLAAAAIGRSM